MARTFRGVVLQPARTDERPARIHSTAPGFFADLGAIYAEQLDDESIILVPEGCYLHDSDEAAEFRWRESGNGPRCWKATVIYEQLGQSHPHIVP
jgi:hypothetical protein